MFENQESVIKMIIKGRSPVLIHVSRTHKVALDWFFDRINLDPKIQIKYIDTRNQLADILTKGIFGSQTFVPRSVMCKKQTSVSHSSTESEIISLDAGLRMDGIPSVTLGLVTEIFHSIPNENDGPKREPWRNPSAVATSNMHNSIPIKHTNVIPTNTDHIPPNTKNSDFSAMLYVFEDNEAVTKMIIRSRSPTMRHVSRNREVALDWLSDRINLGPQTQIRYIDTNFTRDEWNNQSSSCVQYQPFQLHMLHQECQLDKLLHNGEEYTTPSW